MTRDGGIGLMGALLGMSGLSLVLALDRFYWHTAFFWREVPNVSPGHMFRSVLILLSVGLIGGGLVGRRRPVLSLAGADGLAFERVFVAVGALLTGLFPLIYLLARPVFMKMAHEDGPVEMGSFVLLILSSGVLAAATARCRGGDWRGWLFRLALGLMAVVFFLAGMEEVSWLQRVVGFKTPDGFDENLQGEFNLHNFETNVTEYLYYSAAFALTVVMPFLRGVYGLPLRSRQLPFPLPHPFVAVLGCAACVYTFDMWNGVLTQVMFFSAFYVLAAYVSWAGNRTDAALAVFMLGAVLLAGTTFLMMGCGRPTNVEANEYRELLMPLAFLACAVSTFRETVADKLPVP